MYAPPPYSESESDMTMPGAGEQDSLLVEPPSYEEVQLLKAQEAAGELPLPPYSSVRQNFFTKCIQFLTKSCFNPLSCKLIYILVILKDNFI